MILNYNEHTQGQATPLEKEANLVTKIERISNIRRVDWGKAKSKQYFCHVWYIFTYQGGDDSEEENEKTTKNEEKNEEK